jgi:GxxExxY protein
MGVFLPIPARLNEIGTTIVDSCYTVHSLLGPGLLESVYALCLAEEIKSRALHVQLQQPVPVVYKGIQLEGGFRLDLLVESQVIVELKAVDIMLPVFEAQLLTYLKLSGRRLGYLVNFNVPLIRDGIKRMVL